MVLDLSHFLWLAAVGASAIALLRPNSSASIHIRRLGVLALIAVAADGVAWSQGWTLIEPLLPAIGGVLFFAAALDLSRPGVTTGANPAAAPASELPRDQLTPPSGPSPTLSDALELWPEAAAVADSEGRFQWANRAWRDRHGTENVRGKTWTDFQAPSDAVRWQILLEDTASSGGAESVLQHRGPKEWSSRSYLLSCGQGSAVFYFMVSLGLSDSEAALRQETREVGHNLNNVLSAVVGNVGLAIETPGIDEDLQADLREAETGALRAAELIHQLQALARGES